MTDDAGHRWLGYRPDVIDRFVSVCSCGWQSPPQRTAGLAGALLDAHRREAEETDSSAPDVAPGGLSEPAADPPPAATG